MIEGSTRFLNTRALSLTGRRVFVKNGGAFLDTFACHVKSHSTSHHREPSNRRSLRRATSPQLPAVLVRTTLFRAGAKYGRDRSELAGIGPHQFAAAPRIDWTRLCHPNDHIDPYSAASLPIAPTEDA